MNKKIASIKARFDKKFGFNALRPASDLLEEALFRIPSGSISLDIALGGGIPGGRMTHLCGDYSAGKSALLYMILANAQKMEKVEIPWDKYCTKEHKVTKEAIYPLDNKKIVVDLKTKNNLTASLIQYEAHSYANAWAEKLGMNTEDLLFVTPSGLEEGLDIAHTLQKDEGIDIIGIDSIAAATPTRIIETESQDTYQMGIKPIKLQDYFGKYQMANNKSSRAGMLPCTLIVLNQLRSKIGAYGNPDVASGGRSKDYTAAVEILLRKGDYITTGTGDNKRIIGQVIKFKVNKNKTYVPFKTGSYDFYFDEGGAVPAGCIDNAKELIVEAIVYGIIERKGAWFYYKGNQLAQGAEKTIEKIRNDEKLFNEIKDAVMAVAFENEAIEHDNDSEDFDDVEAADDL